jgi:GH24 family phage-related lysozyme (muramidase)
VSFTFNRGEGSLCRSTLRRRLKFAGNCRAVRSELMKSIYSGGKKLPGLVSRGQAVGALFVNGKYD